MALCFLIVLCYIVSLSIPAHALLHRLSPPPPKPTRGVGLLCSEALERGHGGGQGRFNINVLRKSPQTPHSRCLLTVGGRWRDRTFSGFLSSHTLSFYGGTGSNLGPVHQGEVFYFRAIPALLLIFGPGGVSLSQRKRKRRHSWISKVSTRSLFSCSCFAQSWPLSNNPLS